MVAVKNSRLQRIWQKLLADHHNRMRLSHHCLVRAAERFPELLKLTDQEFLDLAKAGKPVQLITFEGTQERGICVHNGKIEFVICFKSAKIASVVPVKVTPPPKPKKGNHFKEPYYRPIAKRRARQQIQEAQCA